MAKAPEGNHAASHARGSAVVGLKILAMLETAEFETARETYPSRAASGRVEGDSARGIGARAQTCF
jgi:hypothetical protein